MGRTTLYKKIKELWSSCLNFHLVSFLQTFISCGQITSIFCILNFRVWKWFIFLERMYYKLTQEHYSIIPFTLNKPNTSGDLFHQSVQNTHRNSVFWRQFVKNVRNRFPVFTYVHNHRETYKHKQWLHNYSPVSLWLY